MGFLLPTLDQAKLDNQRDVVRNERRQNYEMRPYGLAFERIIANLWNPEFPYHWMPIGSHEDLAGGDASRTCGSSSSACTGRRTRCSPSRATSTPARTRALAEKWFGPDPGAGAAGAPAPAPVPAHAEKRRVTMEDSVQLPRLYLAWQTPKVFAPGDAALDLARPDPLRREERPARQAAGDGGADRPGRLGRSDEPGARLDVPRGRDAEAGRLARAARADIDEELARLAAEPPSPEELERAKNKIEAGAVFGLEPVGGFGGRAATLADYYLRTGDPGLPRHATSPATGRVTAGRRVGRRAHLSKKDARVVLHVVPRAAPRPARRARRARRGSPDEPPTRILAALVVALGLRRVRRPEARAPPASAPAAAPGRRAGAEPLPRRGGRTARSRPRTARRPSCGSRQQPFPARERPARPARGVPPPAHRRDEPGRGRRRARAIPAARPGARELHRRHAHRGHEDPERHADLRRGRLPRRVDSARGPRPGLGLALRRDARRATSRGSWTSSPTWR